MKDGSFEADTIKQELIEFYQEKIMAFLKHVHIKNMEAEAEKMHLDE